MTNARGSIRTAAWDSDLRSDSAMEALTLPEDVPPPPPPVQKRPKCPHGKERYYCKECGGKGICPCGEIRKQCRECNGKAFCPTPGCNKRKAYCRDHAGYVDELPASICECGARKSRCKEHGGSELCPCDRIRSSCPEHGPLCPCGIVKITCLECGPFCECGVHKRECAIHGWRYCPCGKRKDLCPEHGGTSLCPCNRPRARCPKHSETFGICEHRRRRKDCPQCLQIKYGGIPLGGWNLCQQHHRRLDRCLECREAAAADLGVEADDVE